MLNTLYTLSGKVQTEKLEIITNKTVVFYYSGEEVVRLFLDKDGYFSYNNDKLQNLYVDSDLPKKLRAMIEETRIISLEINRVMIQTFDKKEVKAIKVSIIVKNITGQ